VLGWLRRRAQRDEAELRARLQALSRDVPVGLVRESEEGVSG
jgi:hypothetical protein